MVTETFIYLDARVKLDKAVRNGLALVRVGCELVVLQVRDHLQNEMK